MALETPNKFLWNWLKIDDVNLAGFLFQGFGEWSVSGHAIVNIWQPVSKRGNEETIQLQDEPGWRPHSSSWRHGSSVP